MGSEDTRLETPEEARLREWFDEQEKASVDNLEGAARLLITLITGLFTLLFSVLAVADDPAPAYLSEPLVRLLGVASVIALVVALWAALAVVLPLKVVTDRSRPATEKAAFAALLKRKSVALTAAVVLFAIGLGALGAALVLALSGFTGG